MVKKYRTTEHYGSPEPEIDIIEIEKESEKCIWIGGQRVLKWTQWFCYFDTWHEAYNYILRLAQDKVNSAQNQLDRYQEKLINIRALIIKD